MSATISIHNISGMSAMYSGTDHPALMIAADGLSHFALHMPAHVCQAIAKAFSEATAPADVYADEPAPMPEMIDGQPVEPLHGGQV